MKYYALTAKVSISVHNLGSIKAGSKKVPLPVIEGARDECRLKCGRRL